MNSVRKIKLSDRNKHQLANKLCTECGICCNGDLFKDVELRQEDDPAKLAALGLNLSGRGRSSDSRTKNPKSKIQNLKFRQPCTAFSDCKCKVYSNRPAHCREFECALLKATTAGAVEIPAALEIILTTRKRADSISRLMERMGDSNKTQCLSIRFRKLQRTLEANTASAEAAAKFSRLAQSVHKLNLSLEKYFYPGSSMQIHSHQ